MHHVVRGMKMFQHGAFVNEIERYAKVDPGNLFPENGHLMEVDFGTLGKRVGFDIKYWAAEMELAITAAEYVQQGSQ